ncbi:TetR-like C-terminal domain-containing protein [Bradyrhizobium sp. RT3a]|uniref:TetR-like C-terminal domain-containing protein n=1 Tax=Bradyrhizobium sp. RT3a TaxID=3156333 RepID=UPI003396BED6
MNGNRLASHWKGIRLMKHPRDFSIDEMLASNWDRRLADDIAAELELASGEPRTSIPEIRRFFAIKSCRDLLGRLESARDGKSSFSALRAVAGEMRRFAVEHPGLAAATFRAPVTECQEWRRAYQELQEFMVAVFTECNICGREGEDALQILRCLVRGFALHEFVGAFLHTYPYDEAYERAMDIFIAGLRVSETERSNIDLRHCPRRERSKG